LSPKVTALIILKHRVQGGPKIRSHYQIISKSY